MGTGKRIAARLVGGFVGGILGAIAGFVGLTLVAGVRNVARHGMLGLARAMASGTRDAMPMTVTMRSPRRERTASMSGRNSRWQYHDIGTKTALVAVKRVPKTRTEPGFSGHSPRIVVTNGCRQTSISSRMFSASSPGSVLVATRKKFACDIQSWPHEQETQETNCRRTGSIRRGSPIPAFPLPKGRKSPTPAPPMPGWGMDCEWHSRRDWPKVHESCGDLTYVSRGLRYLQDSDRWKSYAPPAAGYVCEPIGFAEVEIPGRRSTDPDLARRLALDACAHGAGACFHAEDGIYSRPLGPVQQQCARVFFDALKVAA